MAPALHAPASSPSGPVRDPRADIENLRRQAVARSAILLEGSAELIEHHAERFDACSEHVAAASERGLAVRAPTAAVHADEAAGRVIGSGNEERLMAVEHRAGVVTLEQRSWQMPSA